MFGVCKARVVCCELIIAITTPLPPSGKCTFVVRTSAPSDPPDGFVVLVFVVLNHFPCSLATSKTTAVGPGPTSRSRNAGQHK